MCVYANTHIKSPALHFYTSYVTYPCIFLFAHLHIRTFAYFYIKFDYKLRFYGNISLIR
jgi:hypothetical protein